MLKKMHEASEIDAENLDETDHFDSEPLLTQGNEEGTDPPPASSAFKFRGDYGRTRQS